MIRYEDTRDLIQACWDGDKGRVEMLLPVTDPKADGSKALWTAAYWGWRDIVKLLIPVSEPKANKSAALQIAATEGYMGTVRVLIPVSDVDAVDQRGRTAAENALANGELRIHNMLEAESLRLKKEAARVIGKMLDDSISQAPPSMPAQKRSRL